MRTTIKQYLGRVKTRVRDQRGLGLVESVVAVAILGVAVVAFVVALSTGSIAVREKEHEVTAQSLVQAQLEYGKGMYIVTAMQNGRDTHLASNAKLMTNLINLAVSSLQN